MSKAVPHDGDAPFSYLVKVGHISANPVTVRLEANERERQGLAKMWDILSVDRLRAELQVAKWKKDGLRIKGRVQAKIRQACVVTLEPVEAEIDEPVDQIFVPENSRLARRAADDNGELLLDPDGDDLPETFTGDTIDAGVVVAEAVALAIDPYPRRADVVFEGHIEDTGENDSKRNPFAVLKDWKKDD